MAAPKRAPLDAGLIPAKHKDNQATVGQASMTPDKKPEADVQVEQAPATAKVVEEPAGEHPVNKEPAKPTQKQQTAEPEQPEVVVEPEPEAKAPVVAISSAQPAVLHEPAELPRVIITAPVHARSVGNETQQLSAKVSGERLRRFREARNKFNLSGQDIICEALDIWLAHNGIE